MKAKVCCLLFGVALLLLPGSVLAKEIVLPAGTLMTCVLDEPNFSSATVSVGDPFLCHPRSIQMFGRSIFPRGAYLVGHLEADKEPGHFVGKGYLQLAFDRIGLADTDLPLPAKIIAVKGYRVDREGKIIGRGHATRDVVEWMLPPLWPWKVITLPARGPRPTLKGEVAVTLRIMEDIIIPQDGGANRLRESGNLITPHVFANPIKPNAFLNPRPAIDGDTNAAYQPMELPNASIAERAEIAVSAPVSNHNGWRSFGVVPTTLFATKDGTVYTVTQYQRNSDTLAFVLTTGALVTIDLRDLDWNATTQLNSVRGVRIVLRNGPVCNGECLGY
jgi:hypothetical protein